ncbi:hypothetical protein PS645_01660 [Pseudomonas fluorescens]|uniref:Uncharacterized protein n=1 Tax=Pseudomonas fluorescens TaxID=294 RepID=A0A5E6RJN7_PSEFL|nr:hypothetical protein PS645_01660 [Pseudomonas fluorescens]
MPQVFILSPPFPVLNNLIVIPILFAMPPSSETLVRRAPAARSELCRVYRKVSERDTKTVTNGLDSARLVVPKPSLD